MGGHAEPIPQAKAHVTACCRSVLAFDTRQSNYGGQPQPSGGTRGLDYLIVAPDPAGTIESLSALGYSLEAAVADLVDNSVDAGAGRVDVVFHWSGADSFVAVVDDGRGMTPDDLRSAMALALRGPRAKRGNLELGRFGMGLKTASFSQASKLVVWSRTGDCEPAVRVWDLDQVVASGEWRLLTSADASSRAVLRRLTKEHPNAKTIVLWRALTKIVEDVATKDDADGQNHFLAAVARVEHHLAMTFARFLTGSRSGRRRFSLRVNGAIVAPWDPFLEAHPQTRPQPVEHLQIDGRPVLVRPFILPAKKHLSTDDYRLGAGPGGWLDQQGFYVYRNNRLIVAGDWLDLGNFRKDDKHVLARIAVEIPAELDPLWSVDVKKATARPPLPLRSALTRVAKATRVEARRTQAALVRTTAQQKSDELSYVWRPEKKDGQLRIRLNWSHPLVKESLRVAEDARPTIKALLSYIEETVPIAALRMMFDEDEDRDYQAFAESPPEAVIDVSWRLYGAYISQGLTPTQARTRLEHTSPFNEYPDLLSQLDLAPPKRKA